MRRPRLNQTAVNKANVTIAALKRDESRMTGRIVGR